MSYRCNLCPNYCVIAEDSYGTCQVRGCRNDSLYLPYSGVISAAAVDPIEKKPLYHFMPSTMVFSIGFYGCNLSCPFCQNFRISKNFKKQDYKSTKAEAVVKEAVQNRTKTIAYTYSEPIVHFEFILETAELARKAGLKNVLVTNGYINSAKGKELLKYIDAVNIDLKAFNDDFYRNELGGKLAPVLDFIEAASESIHTEITTLVIPGKNDSIEEISEAASFLASIERNIPYHLSAYYPCFGYTAPATPAANLLLLADTAKEHLNFVYTGNISSGYTDTLCPVCNNLLIERRGYTTLLNGVSGKQCAECGLHLADAGIIL